MIQFIGLMVGFYIIVRMIEIVANKSNPAVTKGFAVAGLFITLFFMLMILASGATTPKF